MDKARILDLIRQTAASNGNSPLGSRKFSTETGIANSEWLGKHWARWGDALTEAGFPPNQMNGAFDKQYLFGLYANLARELNRIPSANDFRLKDRKQSDFPNQKVFERLGTKAAQVRLLAEFCRKQGGFDDVLKMCENYFLKAAQAEPLYRQADSTPSGYVYLYKHGTRNEYKIGKTNNTLRREGQLRTELPEQIDPIHFIKTDDPSGIEHYWHVRFQTKRMNGEWFKLTIEDIKAFKRWKRIY